MNIKKLAPWNWFKNEEESGTNIPVAQRTDVHPHYTKVINKSMTPFPLIASPFVFIDFVSVV